MVVEEILHHLWMGDSAGKKIRTPNYHLPVVLAIRKHTFFMGSTNGTRNYHLPKYDHPTHIYEEWEVYHLPTRAGFRNHPRHQT